MSDNIRDVVFELKDDLKILNLLDDNELEEIIPYLELIKCPKDATLFNEGDASGDYLGFIIKGRFEVIKQTEFKGRNFVVALLSRGSFLGELSMFDDEPRSATVAAQEDSELVILKRDRLDVLIKEYPRIGVKILKELNRILAIRLRKSVDRLTVIF